MLKSYDFTLKGPLDQLLVALSGRGAELSAEGRGTLTVAPGKVEVEPLLEEGNVVGVDVRVPFRDSTDLLDAVVKVLVEVAAVSEAKLTDPQRGEVTTLANFSATFDEYLRMARYAGEYGGVSEALGLSLLAKPVDEDTRNVRVLLAIAVFLIALYGTWKIATGLRAATTIDEAPELKAPKEQPLPGGQAPRALNPAPKVGGQ